MPREYTYGPLPPASRPDTQALRLPAGRPAMPAQAAGAPPAWVWQAWRRAARDADRQGGVTPGGVRTDLAVEAHEWLARRPDGGGGVPGVRVDRTQRGSATLQRVHVTDVRAGAAMGKAPGVYSTVEDPGLRERSRESQEAVTELLTQELQSMMEAHGIGRDAPVLVAGLGNWNATPDSLGPRAVGQLLVTRHLHAMLPPEKRGALRPVAAISPGVLGLTGVETTDLVAAVADRIRPAAVICIDALAARSADRLCATVQLSDAGIQPGAGVGNRRAGLNQQSLGVPVFAVGVPTVIHAQNLLPAVASGVAGAPPAGVATDMGGGGPRRFGATPTFPPLWGPGAPAAGVTTPGAAAGAATAGGATALSELIVTPKEIDVLVDDAAEIVAAALNAALHPGIDLNEVLQYLQ